MPPDIIDQLHASMEDPDITDLLLQSIDAAFHRRYPLASSLQIASTSLDTITVTLTHPSVTYSMQMSDQWEDQPDFRFTFTRTTPPHDTITVDLDDA